MIVVWSRQSTNNYQRTTINEQLSTMFLTDDFLLHSETARRLYHDYAKNLPIIDYHNHLPPNEIAEDKIFSNISKVWLNGDHYKWRAMRTCGVNEKFITGNATDEQKFEKWAATVPYTMRNPLFHWTHLELQRYFDEYRLLKPDTATSIFETTSEKLNSPEYSTQNLLRKMNVEVVCTTDDPTDNLQFHSQCRDAMLASHNRKNKDAMLASHANKDKDANMASLQMLPSFRPDKFILIDAPTFLTSIEKLGTIVGSEIKTFEDLLNALKSRADFFASLGCKLSDHGLEHLYAEDFTEAAANKAFQKAREGKKLTEKEANVFKSCILHHLGVIYHDLGWTQQFHLGALRNNNKRALSQLGADTGWDSIGDFKQAQALSKFLNTLEEHNALAKTIIYNLNPADNEIFGTMIGNFNDGSMAGKVQWGSAWWFLDQKDGMTKQINALSNMGMLSQFVGMLTDSRSFLSFPRHEYFRRLLCNLFGDDVAHGELPNDIEWLGKLTQDICYYNAKKYFGF